MDIEIECYECSLFGREVILKLGDYENHNNTWHSEFLESCEQCPLRFSYPNDLDAHVAAAHSEHPCLACWRSNVNHWMTEDEFHLHFLHQHPDCKIKCDTCPNMFTSQNICDQHAAIWHCNVNVSKKICCPVCERLHEPKDMKSHSTSHRGYNFQCRRCYVVFKSSGELKVHEEKCNIK